MAQLVVGYRVGPKRQAQSVLTHVQLAAAAKGIVLAFSALYSLVMFAQPPCAIAFIVHAKRTRTLAAMHTIV